MGALINYLICTVALFVAIVLTCSGGWWPKGMEVFLDFKYQNTFVLW